MDEAAPEIDFEQSVAVLMEDLPAPVRAFLAGERRNDIARIITAKYQLHIDQAAVFERDMVLMLLGTTTPDEFAASLAHEGLSSDVVSGIVNDLNDMVFKPLQAEVRNATQTMARPMSTAPASMPQPARTAPPPPNLPGVMPEKPAAQTPIPPRPTAPTPISAPAQVPTQASTPVPVPGFPPKPKPAPAAPGIPPIYSAEPAPAVPQLKTGPSQTNLMWQTPVPSAWQQRGASNHAPVRPMAPPEKPMPRTMESDIQLMAQRANAPEPVSMPESMAPQPVQSEPYTPAPQAYVQAEPEPPMTPVYQNEPVAQPVRSSYAPPPHPVSPAIPRSSGDPYREPIEARDF